MATRHHLALDILETAHPQVLRVSDASVYNPLLEIDCPWLDILVPGGTSYVRLGSALRPGFVRTVTAVELGLQPKTELEPRGLPDGIYHIAYAVSPQEKTRITVLHLRTTQLQNLLYRLLCALQPSDCEPTVEQNQKLQRLRQLQLLLQAAKAQVEICAAPDQGLELYQHVQKQLTRYGRQHCPTCIPPHY